MNTQEKKIVKLSAELWNESLKLDELHPSQKLDFAKAIHDIQKLVFMRPAYRKYLKKSAKKPKV
jgi:hypothetical protein